MSKSSRRYYNERIDAEFIAGPSGPLFCLFACSENLNSSGKVRTSSGSLLRKDQTIEVDHRHIVLFVPPFGEEINLCRRFYSLLRTRLATAGLHSVQPDLYGTGDSTGKFDEATWQMWQRDLEYVMDHFCLAKGDNDAGNSFSIVAVRAGCLLTQQLLASSLLKEGNGELKSLVFIQPESNGFDIVNRLFRARITAQRFSGNKTQTSADLWACIENGETVHAGGHALSSELCRVLQHMNLDLGTATRFSRQILFELETGVDKHVSADWEKFSMTAKPFWQSYETEPEATLINAIAETMIR